MSSRSLKALRSILESGGEPDDELRAAVAAVADEPGIAWAAVAFLDDGELVVGPSAGEPDEARRVRVPVPYRGATIGELWVDGDADRVFLEQVASLLSSHVLVGWDTGGESWEP